MRLHCWNRAWRDIELDLETGAASVIKLERPRDGSGAPVGFAQFERAVLGGAQIFAVFRQDDSVVFSAGRRRWHLDQPGLRLVHRGPFPFCSRFSVLEDGRETYSILYTHVRRTLWAIADPTYDKIDEETDFFLAFIAEYGGSPEWRGNALRQWSSASE